MLQWELSLNKWPNSFIIAIQKVSEINFRPGRKPYIVFQLETITVKVIQNRQTNPNCMRLKKNRANNLNSYPKDVWKIEAEDARKFNSTDKETPKGRKIKWSHRAGAYRFSRSTPRLSHSRPSS